MSLESLTFETRIRKEIFEIDLNLKTKRSGNAKNNIFNKIKFLFLATQLDRYFRSLPLWRYLSFACRHFYSSMFFFFNKLLIHFLLLIIINSIFGWCNFDNNNYFIVIKINNNNNYFINYKLTQFNFCSGINQVNVWEFWKRFGNDWNIKENL